MASLIPKTNATVGSATPPTAGALATGELAENKYTGRLYLEKEDGTVVDTALVQLTGDLSGTTSAPTSNLDGGTIAALVKGLNGIALTTASPSALQAIVYSTTENKWTYGNPSASSISGYPLSSIAPTTGQVLQFQTNTDGVQRWTPATIPIISATCNFDGIPRTGKSYTRSSTTVTVTYASHGYSTGMIVEITSATDAAVNAVGKTITVIDANSFSFQTAATGANGTLTIRSVIRRQVNVASVTSNSSGEYTITFTSALASNGYSTCVTVGSNTTLGVTWGGIATSSVVGYNTACTTSAVSISTYADNTGTIDSAAICVIVTL